MYIVNCSVSGGVTGSRSSVLKEKGKTRYFDTFEEASSHASELTKTMDGNRPIYSPGTRFTYTASAV